MVPVGDVIEWLSTFGPKCSVGVDEGGLTLLVVDEEDDIVGTYEIGGIPEGIENPEE